MSLLLKNSSHPLEVTKMTKKFRSFTAVNKISFEVERGKIFGLLGPNGAGKTTALSIFVGLHHPTSGSVLIFGHNPFKEPLKTKPLLGFVPQELINYPFFNVEEILKFCSGYYGILRNRKRREYLLKRLGLWEHRKKHVKNLSGGMKRRLLIAKSLLHSPQLLFLDEPTAGVDVELRDNLWEFVGELKKENVSVLLTTHYLEEAEKLCDEVAVMNEGCLKEKDSTKNIISSFSHRRVKILLKKNAPTPFNESPFLLSQKKELIILKIPYNYSLVQVLKETKVDLNHIEEIFTQEGSLEEAFKKIIKKGAKQND